MKRIKGDFKVLSLILLTVCFCFSSAQAETKTQVKTDAKTSVKALAAPGQEAKSCRQFVQSFYDWYAGQMNKTSGAPSLEHLIALKAGSFSSELAKGIKADAAASAKVSGEIVGLDFDPILNTQSDVHKYTAGDVKLKGTSYLVPMFDRVESKKGGPVVTPEVTDGGGHWIFTNFHYEKSNIPENSDLLSILKVLRNDRSKWAAEKKHK